MMPVTSIDQPVYLIIDNCVLSMLTECCCVENAGLTPRQLLDVTQEWLLNQLAIFQSLSIDNLLYTTDIVSEEYMPQFGTLGLRGLPAILIKKMATRICQSFAMVTIDISDIDNLRNMPYIEKRLANPNTGLSDQDLSLVLLGLKLTSNGLPVVLLSIDQDLLQFVSWVRTQKVLRTPPRAPLLLEGWNCLAYLELIHRSCWITSSQMEQIIRFTIQDTFNRMTQTDDIALSSTKASRIIHQVTQINQQFIRSIEIKIQQKMVNI